MNDRAVVLCRTAAGMRTATWLAQRGVAVRVLCTSEQVPSEEVALVAGPREGVEALVGPVESVEPSLSMWFGGASHPLPRRKRDLAARVHQGHGSVFIDLLAGRLHGGGSAEDWVRRYFGSAAWSDAIQGWLDHRLAGPSARAPGGVVRHLLGAGTHGGWWRPRWDGATRAERRVDAILDGGGEVLTDVVVEGIELEQGRVVGLHSDVGFEPVEGTLYTDLTPGELAPLLDDASFVPPHPPLGDRVRVLVDGSLDADACLVLDGARRLLTLARSGDQVAAEVVLSHGEPLFDAPDVQVGHAVRERLDGIVGGLGAVRSVDRQRARVACPRPSVEAPWESLSMRLTGMGIQPVGETGLLLPVGLLDELALLEQAAAGTVLRTQRERWLTDGPPVEPWSLLVQA